MSFLTEFEAEILMRSQHIISNWPATRFFEPNGRFFAFMDQFKGKFICDCGSGSGFVPHALRAWGHDADGIDLYSREDGYPVTIKDATERVWRPSDFVLVCRPSHGGWAGEVIQNAIDAGAMVGYVGLYRNIYTDLTEEQINAVNIRVEHVGSDDEFIWGWGEGFRGAQMPSSAVSPAKED